MHVLITGGAGFIGSHTADGLLERGHTVRILDSLEPPVHRASHPPYLPPGAEFIKGDVRSRDDLDRALRGVDAVIHLAAYQDYLTDFSRFFHVNAVGTALLYELIVAQKYPIQKVVVASSQAVYGEGKYECNDHGTLWPGGRPVEHLERGEWDIRCPVCRTALRPVPTDETAVNPTNSYAISKYTQELIALNLGRRYRIPTAAMRYSIVQGPRQSFSNAYSGACRIFCLRMQFGHPPVVYEDGRQLRDYVYIGDVVQANLLVLEREEADGEVFNVGGGRAVSVLEFARTVADVFGRPVEPEVAVKYRYGDTRHIISDISKLRRLGWTPEGSVSRSVREYVAWLRAQPDLQDYATQADETMSRMQVVRQVRERETS
ncbi:MAG: SDR family NAD(P)-dependent oxidoreductase [Candidatus Latescibacteria bacterium]|nr:SDR family NAD(P)-dependent oxidoreductase [Candidatus Latescibacterota bacterium]